MVVDKLQKKAAVIDVTIPSDSNIKKKGHKKLKKYQALKKEVEKMDEVKATQVQVVIRAETGKNGSPTGRMTPADPRNTSRDPRGAQFYEQILPELEKGVQPTRKECVFNLNFLYTVYIYIR